MKINHDSFKVEQKAIIRQALMELISQPDDKTKMPCPSCHDEKPQTKGCQDCSPACPYAKQQMSSEPEKYPIEEAILPLVYAFYSLRLLMPCWSCEGHNNGHGDIFKTPKLWFYTTHDFYPKLIAQYVSGLKGEGKLNNHWGVRILPFSQTMFTTTYSLEPLDINTNETNLASLQQDIKTIAQNLRQGLFKLANHYIQRANKSPLN